MGSSPPHGTRNFFCLATDYRGHKCAHASIDEVAADKIEDDTFCNAWPEILIWVKSEFSTGYSMHLGISGHLNAE